ncbi:MAG: helix-turn-helix domain-containing protein [Lachnospiraceae bacterium]|nr:helix-turn-helix domain-containing protein [Lachnospiraceae bacterium]
MKNMISRNLAYLRRANGYSQEEVAEKIGVSRQAVAKWENGDSIPDLANSIALSELYRVTLDNLVKYEERASKLPIPEKGKHIFGSVTVGERGQIVIPKKAREIFHIGPGDSLLVLGDESQGIAIVKSDEFLKAAHDILKKAGASDE